MRLNVEVPSLKIASLSLGSVFLLSACSLFQTNEHHVKDSLYVWSEAFDESIEANRVTTEYHTIQSLEENMAKSDVQLLFEAMVNNEIEAIDLNDTLPSKSEPEQALEVRKTNSPVVLDSEIAQVDTKVITTVADINRITNENPTAAGIPVNKVLPDIKQALVDVPLTKEIVSLAQTNDYQIEESEFGMWFLAKADNSPYQEMCSLSSATVQIDDGNYASQVWLKVVGNALLVNSTTNIDITKPGVGLKFDERSRQSFNKPYFRSSAVWSGDLAMALNNYKQVNISIGGTELSARTHQVTLDLKDLKNAYSEYQKCNRGIQIGSL